MVLAAPALAGRVSAMDILFVTSTRIGDAVLSSGLLSYLVERHPGARITVAAGPLALPLFAAVPGLERAIPVVKRRFSLHWVGLFREVVGRRWDLIVDLRGSALAWLLWAGKRRVMAKGDPREHRVRQLARLFDLDPPPGPKLWTAPAHERAALALLPPGPPVLALAPAANWRGKEWRVERFAELARRLTRPGGPLAEARVAVSAAAHERAQAAPLLAALPPAQRVDIVGVDLPTTAAIFRRCALFVGNDSGLMHIAAACGTPTLGLFGPSAIEQYAPWGERAAAVQTATPRDSLFGPGYDPRTTNTLMDSLSVEMAEAAACRLLCRIGSAAA